jgi:hypothetical protein
MEMSRRLPMIALLFLSVLATSAADAKPKTAKGPVVVFDAAVRDAGVVGDGEPGGASFTIRNGGGRILRLTLATKAEGLKGTPPQSVEIKPNQKISVRLDVDTWLVAGEKRLDTTYTTNDPAHATITLALKINVKSYVLANPGFARYIFVQQEKPGTIVQTLFPTDGTPFKVTGAHSAVPWLAVSFRPATEAEHAGGVPDPQWHVETTLLSNAPVGTISETVRIDIDHPRQKEVRIHVNGFVRPIFAVTPQAADLGRVKIGQPLPQSGIYIQNFSTDNIALSDPTVDVRGLAVTIETLAPGHQYRARISMTSDAKEGTFAGTIILRTSSSKEEYVEIPIRGEFIR